MWGSTSQSAIKQRATSHCTADCSGLNQQSAKIILSVCSNLYTMWIHRPLCRTPKQPDLTKIFFSPSVKDGCTAQIVRQKALLSYCGEKNHSMVTQAHLHYKRKEVTVFSSISSTSDFFNRLSTFHMWYWNRFEHKPTGQRTTLMSIWRVKFAILGP